MEKRNVPKLRFKGFEDEWKEYKLGNFLEFKNGINADKDDYGKGVKFINVLDILSNNYISYDNIIGRVNIDDKTLEKYSVNYGDILFQRSSETREEVGTANVYLGDKTVTFGGFVIRGKKIGEYNPMFMNGLLKSKSARKEITTKSGGSTRYNVGQEILMDVNIKLPSLEEQTKIANFLSNVDNIIEEQEGKVKDLEQYKKGMMQKIFKQEVRFKDENGGEYPEWIQKTLKYVLKEVVDKTKINNQYEVLSSTNNGIFKQSEYFNREIASSDNTGYKILKLNQIVLSPQNLWLGNINYNYKYNIGIVSPSYKIFSINSFLNKKFISYIIKNNRMIYEYKQASEQGASIVRRNLNIDLFYDIKVQLPCLEEQTKIENFLSNIDNIIEEEKKKLEDLRLWKKGLLQQMFV